MTLGADFSDSSSQISKQNKTWNPLMGWGKTEKLGQSEPLRITEIPNKSYLPKGKSRPSGKQSWDWAGKGHCGARRGCSRRRPSRCAGWKAPLPHICPLVLALRKGQEVMSFTHDQQKAMTTPYKRYLGRKWTNNTPQTKKAHECFAVELQFFWYLSLIRYVVCNSYLLKKFRQEKNQVPTH